ncbi:phage tail protein [Xenorhabdus stockiae]|uniref:phage tail-collar fiber domain-containing protein n=1 Tax=Xenorhabdus stockiae TaxID=351614 RepID=UPI003CF80866
MCDVPATGQINRRQPVVLDEFVFANVPDLDPTQTISRDEKLPAANQIVHRQAVNKTGLASENAVAYSVTLGTEVGHFDFNWIGLINKASGVIGMITHAPTQKKIKTANGLQGNVLTRSFLLEFEGAATETAITTTAETWQIDFTARLTGIDEMQRLINTDSYGEAAFFGDSFAVVRQSEQYLVKKGLAYVGGLRGELAFDQTLNSLRNTRVYADFSYQGNLVSQWKTAVKITAANELKNYVDAAGYPHYVFAIACIDGDGNVIDLRSKGSLSDQALAVLKKQFKLDLSTKIDKANISGIKGYDNEKVPSLNLLTTEVGKLQSKGHYADGNRFQVTTHNVAMTPSQGTYALALQNGGALLLWDGSKSVFRVSPEGEITDGSMAFSRLTGVPFVQDTGNSVTSFMSQKAVTDALNTKQSKGNYAAGNRFQVTTHNVAMTPSQGTYALALQNGGALLLWDGSKSVFRVSPEGEITDGAMAFSRLTDVPIVQATGNSATSFMSQKAVTDASLANGVVKNMINERVANIRYVNHSSRARHCIITGDFPKEGEASVEVDGITVQYLKVTAVTVSTFAMHFYASFIVPAGKSYTLKATSSFILGRWTEIQ